MKRATLHEGCRHCPFGTWQGQVGPLAAISGPVALQQTLHRWMTPTVNLQAEKLFSVVQQLLRMDSDALEGMLLVRGKSFIVLPCLEERSLLSKESYPL